MIALVFVLSPFSAFAGSYHVAYSGGTVDPSDDGPFGERDGFYIGLAASATTNTVSGTITATFTWAPAFPSEQPPSSVIVKQYCRAGYFSGDFVEVPPTGSASNGLGDPEIKHQGTQTTPDGTLYNGSGVSEGTHYQVKQNPGTGFTVTCSPNASGTMSDPILGAPVVAEVRYQAADLTKAVSISRGGNPRYETADADGTKHGDTIYSWKHWTDDWGIQYCGEFINWQPFSASRLGTWSDPGLLSFTWNPSASFANISVNSVSMPFGNPYRDERLSVPSTALPGSWFGDPTGPRELTVTYTLSDLMDGGSASASYVLHLHDQVENLTDDVVPETIVTPTGEVEVGLYDVTVRGPINREYTVQQGAWSWEVGFPEIVHWFPTFSVGYTLPVTSTMKSAPWSQTIYRVCNCVG